MPRLSMPRLSLRHRMILVCSALTALACGAWLIYENYERYKRFAIHEPGKVYRSSWLEPDAMAEVVRTYKIRTVLNLCDGTEKCEREGTEGCTRIEQERQAVEAAGGRVIELSYPGNYTWHAESVEFDETERLFADPEAYPILVHCYHGKERTVKALAIYDIHFRGMTAQDSLDQMPIWGSGHPWPIITFAFNYESKNRERAARTASAGVERR